MIHPCDDNGDRGAFCHALNLVTAGLWRDLVATRQFTTDEAIYGAIQYGLEYSSHLTKSKGGYISPVEAANLMTTIGSVEPDRTPDVLLVFSKPFLNEGKAAPCPVNGLRGKNTAWGLIYGIGQGWFFYDRGGFLRWTAAGRDARGLLNDELL